MFLLGQTRVYLLKNIALKSNESRNQLSELLARCVLREEKALDELYHLMSSHLFSIALRIVTRRDWAEEVLQESIINIWRNASSYNNSKGHPVTWMVSIVRNKAIDWIRNVGNRSEYNHELDEGVVESLQNPQSDLIDQEWSKIIIACLDGLESAQRDAIALVYYKGFTHQELVKSMQRPLGTVKSWVRRGLAQLKRGITLETGQ